MQNSSKIKSVNNFLRNFDYTSAIQGYLNLLKYHVNEFHPLYESVIFNLRYSYSVRRKINAQKTKRPRIAVYTAITGKYDSLKEPLIKPENVDYFVFTDNEVAHTSWVSIPFNYYNGDASKVARFVKLNPHLYFQDYDLSIWVDANVHIIGDVNDLIDRLPENEVLGLFSHPHRACLYVEGQECVKRNKDAPEPILNQLKVYKERQHPENSGMWETGVLIRRHNTSQCIKIMSEWWMEVFTHSKRDQISLPYVIKNNNSNPHVLGRDLRDDCNFIYSKHTPNNTFKLSTNFCNPIRMSNDVSAISATIVVCVYNALSDVMKCLDALYKNKRVNDNVIIVDDCSGDETKNFLEFFCKDKEKISLIRNSVNLGYTKSANIGLKSSNADYTILLNSDTIIAQASIANLIVAGEFNPYIGIVGPLSNAATWQSVPYLKDESGSFAVNLIPAKYDIEGFSKLIEKNAETINPYCHLVNGFCYAIKRKVIEKIGYLDEVAFPVGYGEEDDYSLRAIKAGFISCIAVNSFVYHAKSKSFTPEGRKPLAKAGLNNLVRKHGDFFVFSSVDTLSQNKILDSVRSSIVSEM